MAAISGAISGDSVPYMDVFTGLAGELDPDADTSTKTLALLKITCRQNQVINTEHEHKGQTAALQQRATGKHSG